MHRFTKAFKTFPPQLWLLCLGALLTSIGNAAVFPFFTVYLNQKLGASMTLVGALLSLNSFLSLFSQTIGGELADRWGRKSTILLGLATGAVVWLWMGTVRSIVAIIPVLIAAGLIGNLSGPATQSMIADLIPSERRTEAYSLQRIAVNLGFAIGPAIGGFIATRSYVLLFISAAVLVLIVAFIFALFIRETKPEGEPILAVDPQNGNGYKAVLKDRLFMAFCLLSILSMLGYAQIMTTLPVYMKKWHNISEAYFGTLMSINGGMIVLLQFPIARLVEPFNKAISLAVGSLIYAFGFTMVGFSGAFYLFAISMAVITLGELVIAPVSTAFTADLAPEHLRGRYMGVSGLTWGISFALGALVGGAAMDRIDPRFIWFGSGVLSALAGIGFIVIKQFVKRRFQKAGAR